MTQHINAQQPTQGRQQSIKEEPMDHSATEPVGWLKMLLSVISGTKRAIWEFFLWVRNFLPLGSWYWPRWTERGFEIVIRLPPGTEIAIGMTNRGPYVRIGNRTWFPFNSGNIEDNRNNNIRNFRDEENFDLVVGEEQYLDPESLDANNAARSREEQDFYRRV